MEALAVVSLVGREAHGASVHPNTAVRWLRAGNLVAAVDAGDRFTGRQAKPGSRVERTVSLCLDKILADSAYFDCKLTYLAHWPGSWKRWQGAGSSARM